MDNIVVFLIYLLIESDSLVAVEYKYDVLWIIAVNLVAYFLGMFRIFAENKTFELGKPEHVLDTIRLHLWGL